MSFKLQLTFGSQEQLKFADEDEFFEMLGILCKDGSTKLSGSKTEWFTLYNPKSGRQTRRSDLPEGATDLDAMAYGCYTAPGLSSFVIVCSPYVTYPDALSRLIKDPDATYKVSCAEYVRYLMEHFGAYLHCDSCGSEYTLSVKLPPIDEVRDTIVKLGLGEHMDAFEKGAEKG